jgi:hypothetical protein
MSRKPKPRIIPGKNWEDAGFEYNCEEKRLSDDLFTAPNDVNFTDWTETMQNLQQIGQQMQQNAATGAGTPPNMEDIEAQLEALQQQDGTGTNE